MVRNILAVVAGYVAWTLIFLGGGAAIRAARPDVHSEDGVTSDVSTLAIYLAVSIIASLVAGLLTTKIAESSKMMYTAILAVCLLATGIPVQLGAWDVLPVWYNLAFLILLVPVTMLGGIIAGSKSANPKDATT